MKTIVEMIAVMQAYADGQKIECVGHDELEWHDCTAPHWDWSDIDYRIKVEPKYRPYKNAEECFADVQKHGGWVDGVMCDHHKAMIIYISNQSAYLGARVAESVDFVDLFHNFHWADDMSICGVLEDEI